MPYIRPEIQDELDAFIDDLVSALIEQSMIAGRMHDPAKLSGNLTYVITALFVRLYGGAESQTTGRYHSFVQVQGILANVAHEYYRRVIAPYEDRKIEENGDVF